jgi:hypothetical protein
VAPVVRRPPKRRWYQYTLRDLLIVMTVFSIVMSCYAWFQHTQVEPYRVSQQIEARICSLASKCPPSLRKDQWEIAVEWTGLLAGNSLPWGEADLDDLRRFQRELEEKAKGDVDMTTIFWIWDRHAQLTPSGKRYQRFRQQMLDEMHWGESAEIQGR